MHRLYQCFFLIGLVSSVVMPVVSAVNYQNKTTLNSGSYRVFAVCGAVTPASCSAIQIYYSIQAVEPVSVYWMDLIQYPVFAKNPSTFTGDDGTRSCLKSQSCLETWFTGTDPDKTLIIYNPGSKSTIVGIAVQTRPVQSSGSSNQWPGWLIGEIVVAVVIAAVGISGLLICGWYWRGANPSVPGPEGSYRAPTPEYNDLES